MKKMSKKIPMKGGDEFDALSRKSKSLFKWRAGARKKIKQKYNKRFRKNVNRGNNDVE